MATKCKRLRCRPGVWLRDPSSHSLSWAAQSPGPRHPSPGQRPFLSPLPTLIILHVSKKSESNPLDLMLSQCKSSKTSDEKIVKTSGEETEIPGQKREACHYVKKKEDQHWRSPFSEWNGVLCVIRRFMFHPRTSRVSVLCGRYPLPGVHVLFCPRTEPEEVTPTSPPAASAWPPVPYS